MKISKFIFLNFLMVSSCFSKISGETPEAQILKSQYENAYYTPSDINEHIPVLRRLAIECSSAIEIGTRSMNSTWGVLYGLSENPSLARSYMGIDLNSPPKSTLDLARYLAEKNGIAFTMLLANDMHIQIPETDLLFIDSLHTYCHLSYELEKFSPNVRKYIAMHDTSPPWENIDDTEYWGDY